MSDIVELLRTIGELARIVAARDAEIQDMKSAFDKRIEVLNTYISQLELYLPQQDDDLPPEQDLNIPVTDFIKTLESFKDTRHDGTSGTSGDDYVLVPTRKLRYLLKRPSPNTPPSVSRDGKANPVLTSTLVPVYSGSSLGASVNPHPKRTCSYCNQPGHSRARCIERLAKPAR